MASALGRAAMVGVKGIPAAGASRRVAVSGAAKRGFKTNPHVEVNEENCLSFFTTLCYVCAWYDTIRDTSNSSGASACFWGLTAECDASIPAHGLVDG